MGDRCANTRCKRCAGAVTGVCLEDIAQSLGLFDEAAARVFRMYQVSAKLRGHPFSLTLEQVATFLGKECGYCGAPPLNAVSVVDDGTHFKLRYQGIDRVDNRRGYEVGNLVSCCAPCNRAKGVTPVGEFIERARRIAGRV